MLLLLDEPSTGLDPGARRELWDHLERLRRTLGTTVMLTTHLMDEAAKSERVAVLHEGRLVALGSPTDLVSEIGGDVILVASNSVEMLAADIRRRFCQAVDVVDGHVRIERAKGHAFISELVEAFPEQIDRGHVRQTHPRGRVPSSYGTAMELMLATYALWRRDIARFLRQRSRIVGALGTPLVFWILLGSGLGSSFSVGSLGVPAGGYLEYFLSGHASAHPSVYRDFLDDLGD